VTPLAAAVQPLVTIALDYLFLGERVGAIESVGIGFAIASPIALSNETKVSTIERKAS